MAQKSKNNNKMNMNMPRPSMLWIYGLIGLFIIGWYLFDGSNEAPLPSDWTTVQEMVEKGDVEKIQVVNRDQAQVFLKKEAGEKYRNDSVDKRFRRLPESGVQLTFTIGSVDSFREDLKAAEEKSGQTVPVIYENKANDWTSILINLLPWVVIIGAWFFIMRSMSRGAGAGGGIMNVGKAKAQVFDKDNSKRVTFKDVAGLEEAKVEIMEIVDFLKKADKYKELGAKIPKGALLVGPPGTGKTLLAKAVAGEANVPFLSISGSDFVEMFVGVGASRVRDLFDQAKKHAPCIVFIDEIDAVGRRRGAGMGGGHDEREQTLNQLLVEMDGFAVNEGVIVLAATNRKDILDPALLRPGRFDRQITVGYPDVRGREAILRVHAKEKPLADDVDLANIAKRTPYFAGADLENIMNEAAILCAREGKEKITMRHLNDAIERVQMGPEKKSHIVSDEDKRLVACHEAGHAIVGELLGGCDDVHLVTIMPRGGSGGHTLLLPDKESDFTTRTQLLDFVAMALGGYAAETLVMGQMSTGASSDLQRATDICRRMVTQYGMSDDMGPIYLGGDHDEVFLARDYGQQSRTYSEDVAARIDAEVQRKMNDALARATAILKEHRAQLDGLSDLLVEKETIDRAEFVAFLKGEPCPEKKEENVLREPEQV